MHIATTSDYPFSRNIALVFTTLLLLTSASLLAQPFAGGLVIQNNSRWLINYFNTVVSDEAVSSLPIERAPQQNYPNPFNPVTTIDYQLPEQTRVRLEVFDMLGRKVATLVDENQAAGTYSVPFDATNLSSGVYIYRLEVAGKALTKKLTLIK